MEFAKFVSKASKKISSTPRKLPRGQLKTAIKSAKSSQGLHRVLRYCEYEQDSNSSLFPSIVMCEVVIKRAMLYYNLESLTSEDRLHLKQDLNLVQKHSFKRLDSLCKWQLAFLLEITGSWPHRRSIKPEVDVLHMLEVAEDRTEVDVSEAKGRLVKATKRIEAGEVVSYEPQPLTFIVYDPEEGKREVIYCVHCAEATRFPWPCPRCPDVLYCSITCAEAALLSYHKYECELRLYGMLGLFSKGMDSLSVGKMLNFRILTQRNDIIIDCTNLALIYFTDSKQDAGRAETFQKLMDLAYIEDQENDAESDIFNEALIKMLEQHTSYFKEMSETKIDLEQQRSRLLGLMRRWSSIIEVNSFAMEVPKDPRARISFKMASQEAGQRQIGTILFSKSSMFNHSCDPNAAFVIKGQANFIIATGRIEAGEEICISYGPTFPNQSRKERINMVQKIIYYSS